MAVESVNFPLLSSSQLDDMNFRSDYTFDMTESGDLQDDLQITLNPLPSPSSSSTRSTSDNTEGIKPSRFNCDRRRPDEEEVSRLPNMPQEVVGQTVTPFLREHIPGVYAPIGKPGLPVVQTKNPNSKFCYRHRPDSKCRRAADETKMGLLQSELEKLPSADQQAITHVWSLFSAAPSKHRELMLQGIITQCCFPQLSMVSREVSECLKIDFITALPNELSLKILSFLDSMSLCKAAQVSRRWKTLADDDVVWHRMCEQHIERKCTSCGWGLPRLEKQQLREFKRQRQLAAQTSQARMLRDKIATQDSPANPAKRGASEIDETGGDKGEENDRAKKQCTEADRNSVSGQQHQSMRQFRPWKEVYRDRFRVGSNWKYGRCSIKVFRGEHTNGVTCLQFDDNMLATGSYDSTIKLWNIDNGEVFRTLQGHTSGIRALQFDDRLLVSGSLDGTVKLWAWRKGECIKTLQHGAGVITVHMDGGLLASGSMDHSIKIFNFKTQEVFCLRGHTDYVNQVRIDVASRTLFSASDDCKVKLWDLDSRMCIRTYEGHSGQVQQVMPLPDDYEFEDETHRPSDVVSVSSARSSTPGAAGTESSQSSTAGDDRSAYSPVFEHHPERHLPPRYMLTGSLDATMRLWDTATGECLRTFFGHVEGIWSLVGDSLRYVTGANDATVKIWDPKSGKCERTFTGHEGPVMCVGLSDSRMASGGEDGEVHLYKFDCDPSEIAEFGTPA